MADDQVEAGGEDQVADTGGEAVVADAGTPGEDAEQAMPAGFPDDWRSQMANGNEKYLKVLDRYQDPAAVGQAMWNLRQSRDSGDLIPKLGDEPTEDEVASYRKAMGVPDAPGDYDLTFESGLVVGEEDKAMVDSFLEVAHAKNMAPAHVKDAVEFYYNNLEAQAEMQGDRDNEQRETATGSLVEDWGADYKPNMNSLLSFLGRFPDDVKELVQNARLGDGSGMLNNVEVIKTLVGLEREINPTAMVVPAGDHDKLGSLEDQISGIEKLMGDKTSDYWRGPDKDKIQKKYRDLVTARDKVKNR